MMPDPIQPKTISEHIKATTSGDFRADVMQVSLKVPVLVDFWAPWCGPCKQLTPILEKVVKSAGGKIKLVTMNIEEHPQIAGQLGIQSLPAVFAFEKGQPIDGFQGALPESQIKAFVERLVGPLTADVDALIKEGEAAITSGELALASEKFSAVLVDNETHLKALGGLARTYVLAGEIEQATSVLTMVPAGKAQDAAIVAAQAALDVAVHASSVGDLALLERAIATNPKDFQARLDLAVGLNAQNKREAAVDQLIEIIRADRKWDDDGGRRQLLQFFEAWGVMDQASIYGRRRLSSVIFR